jgi:hypothetical protein
LCSSPTAIIWRWTLRRNYLSSAARSWQSSRATTCPFEGGEDGECITVHKAVQDFCVKEGIGA